MKAAAGIFALALASCATVPPATAGSTAAIGQTAYTNGLRVRPIEVVEDSRCPVNVQCVWAGRIRLEAIIELRGGSEELRTTLTMGQPMPVADGALTLVAVIPQKKAGAEIDSRSYQFTFDFQGGI